MRWHADPAQLDAGRDISGTVAAFLLGLLIFGGLVVAVVVGQDLMCSWHDDALSYCPGYEAQR